VLCITRIESADRYTWHTLCVLFFNTKQEEIMGACNEQIQKAMELSRQLIILADDGEAVSDDDGCILLYSIIRDCGYRIRKQAVHEREAHKMSNRWK